MAGMKLIVFFMTIGPNVITQFIETSTTEQTCPCTCEYYDKLKYWESQNAVNNKTEVEVYQELLPQLKAMQKNLTENKKDLTSYKMTKISAPDKRPSAKQIGSFGIVILVVVIGLIIAVDISSFHKHVACIKKCRKF